MTDTSPSPSQSSEPTIEEQIAAIEQKIDFADSFANNYGSSSTMRLGAAAEARTFRAALVTLRAHEAQARELAEAAMMIETLKKDNRDLVSILAEARKEIERLTTELSDTHDDYLRRHKDACDHYLRIHELEAELARLRAPTGKDAMDVARSVVVDAWSGAKGWAENQGAEKGWAQRTIDAVTCEQRFELVIKGVARAETEARFRPLVEWQPIKTVPKDGSTVLLLYGEMLAYPLVHSDFWDGVKGDWWHHKGGEIAPTHWLPLPSVDALAALEEGNQR